MAERDTPGSDDCTHGILLEPRRAYSCRREGDRIHTEESPLAYLTLRSGQAARDLVEATGWPWIEDDLGIHLMGRHAEDMAQAFAGLDGVIYPLENGDLRRAPDTAWTVAQELIDQLLSPAPEHSAQLLALLPSGCEKGSNLWVRALPEALLGDRHPLLQSRSAVSALFGSEAPGMSWSWVVGERGTSIGARYGGQEVETYLGRGLRSVIAKTATTVGMSPEELDGPEGASRGAVEKTQSIFTRDLVEKLVGRSIRLFPEAWSEGIRPAVTLTVAVPGAAVSRFRCALPPALVEFGVERDFSFEVVDLPELLVRSLSAPSSPAASVASPGPRPRAYRPRAQVVRPT